MAKSPQHKQLKDGCLSNSAQRTLVGAVSLSLIGILMSIQAFKLSENIDVAQMLAIDVQQDYISRQVLVRSYLVR